MGGREESFEDALEKIVKSAADAVGVVFYFKGEPVMWGIVSREKIRRVLSMPDRIADELEKLAEQMISVLSVNRGLISRMVSEGFEVEVEGKRYSVKPR